MQLNSNSHLIGLSVVITTSKYVQVSIQGAATRPRHGGRDFSRHVKHLPSKNEKKEMWINCIQSSFMKKNETANGSRKAAGISDTAQT